MHPAPGEHISAAGCTIFGGVHPECARFFWNLSLLHIRRVHGENPGCTVLGELHSVGAQNKTLISDTAVNMLTSVILLVLDTVNTNLLSMEIPSFLI